MRLPAIAVSRWAINAEGNVYRLDGYVGIGTDSPSGMLGLGDELTYITVNSSGEITFTDAVNGTQSLSTFTQSANNIANLNEAIQTILKDLDGYTNVNTDLEHYIQHSDAIQTILKDLDGYATIPSDGSSSDGYVAFFIGTSAIAGDNDLFWDRTNNRLGIGTTSPAALLHVAGASYFDGYIIPFTDDTWGLGTTDRRWRDLYLGPGSLHIKSTISQTETGVERDWALGADGNGDLTVSQDGLTYARFSNDRPINFGAQAITTHSFGAGSVLFGSPVEFDSTVFFDGAATFQQNTTFSNDIALSANLFITMGNNAALYTSSGNAEFNISVGSTYSRNFIFTEFANRLLDHGVLPASDPTIKIFSNINPTVDNTQWFSFNHNQTDGYIQTGVGAIRLSPASNLVKVDGYILPSTDDAYGLGNEEYRWRDLWLGPGSLHIRSSTLQTDTGVERDWTIGSSSDGSLAIKQGLDYFIYVNQDGQLNVISNVVIAGATQIIDGGNKLSIKGTSGVASGNAYFVATDATSTHTTYQGVTSSTGFTGTFSSSPFEIRTSNAPKITVAAGTGVTMNTSLNVGIINQSDRLAYFFSASTSGHSWIVGDKVLDQLAIVVGSEHGQQLVFGPAYSDTTDFFHPIQSDPMMYFHSMTDPGVDPNQWLSISHRKTAGVIETGLGPIQFAPFDGYTSPAIDDAYSLGSPSLRWKDLWLSDASLHLVQNASENDTGTNRQWDLRINSAGDLLINQSADTIMKLASAGGTSTISNALSVTGTLIGPNFQTSASSVILGSLVFVNGPFGFSSGEQSPIFALNQSFDQFGWFGGSSCGNQFILGMQIYYTSDYQHPDQGNPTIFLHSSNDPALDPSQWMSLAHNSVDGYISTGIGNIILSPAGTGLDAYVAIKGGALALEGISTPLNSPGYSKLYVKNTDGDLYFRDDAGVEERITTTVSDISLKTEIEPIQNSLDLVGSLRGVRFKWNENAGDFGEISGKSEIGVIAQEIETVLPEVVVKNKIHKKVQYEKITALLIEAVKELTKKNNTLEERLQKLEDLLTEK